MPTGRRAPFVALPTLLQRRFPDLDDPAQLIGKGIVLVNGVPATNPRTCVRADAAIRIHRPRPLRGTIKLAHALTTFRVRARPALSHSTWARRPAASPRPCSTPGRPGSTPSTPAPASSAGGCEPTPG